MYLKTLNLINFRNYEKLSLDFNRNKTVIVGDNAQGKTNLIEAIYFLATLNSPRVTTDIEYVLWGMPHAFISGSVSYSSGATSDLDVVITPGKAKILKVNKIKKNAYNQFLGKLVAVSFSFDDLLLLRGSPKDRRKWIDTSICQLYPAYYDKLLTYNKIRQHKQALLKTFHGHAINLSSVQKNMLDSWNDQISTTGSNVIYLRERFLKEIAPFAQDKCYQISGNEDLLTINYESSIGTTFNCYGDDLPTVDEIKKQYIKILNLKTEEEILKAQVLVGPHRDDIDFYIDKKEAKRFASQGQQRTIILSLKLSEMDLIKQSLNEDPILLLDDVLAELDLSRQRFLFESISEENQTIITTTDLDSFDESWLKNVEITRIDKGKILNEKTS